MALTVGKQESWRVPIIDEDGSPLDLSGCTVTSSCAGGGGGVLFSSFIEIDTGGVVVDSDQMSLESTAAAGVIVETIPALATASFVPGSYLYTLSILLPSGDEATPILNDPLIVESSPAPGAISTVDGTTRRDIRRAVARMMGDYFEATDASGGQTSQFHDPYALARESSFFKGMQILFSNTGSPHYGKVATVTASDGVGRVIYFEPPLETPTLPGETIELYNFRGRGTTIAQYNATINAAISAARQQHALVPYREELTTPFMRTSPYIDIPQAFVSFSGVETVDRSGYRQHLKPGEYTVDRFSRSIEVRGRARDRLHGLTMTVRGYVMPALLDDDDDRTSIDLEWLYSEAKAQLLERMVASSLPVSSQDRLFLQERESADGKRSMIINHVVPNTIRLN